jgi:hypothetical protein
MVLGFSGVAFQYLLLAAIEREIRIILYRIIVIPTFVIVLFIISINGVIKLSGYSNTMLKVGESNWLTFYGAILGSSITVIGAFLVTYNQGKSAEKTKLMSDTIILLNDLKYITTRVDEYINLMNENLHNQDFYRIRYLNVCINWRELVALIYNGKLLNREEVNKLYEFFTDIYYVNDKYESIQELSLRELDVDKALKEKTLKRKREIKKIINDKYIEMDSYGVKDIIGKLEKYISKHS